MENNFIKEKRAILGLGLGHFNVDLYASLLVPLYPIITSNLGINLASISSIIALGHLVSSLMQPLFGYISDNLRHRVFMVWGLIFSAVFIPLAPKSTTVAVFLACLLFGMVGNALFHPQVSSLVKEFNKSNPNLSRDMGIFLGLGTIGYALGPYLATFWTQKFGMDNLIYLSILGIITSMLIYFLVPKMPNKGKIIKENFFIVFKDILKDKKCMFLTFISTVKSAVSISFGTYIPFLLKKHGFSLEQVGIIVTLFFVAGGLATIYSPKLEKYIGANGVIVISFVTILPLIMLFLFMLEKNSFVSCLFFILTGFFILLSVGVILVQAQNAIPKHTGVVSGVMQGFSWGLGALFLSPLGFLGQNFGIEMILVLMSLLTFIVGLFSLKTNLLK